MAIFSYKAKNGTLTVAGEVEAETEAGAIQALERMGYLPIQVEAKSGRGVLTTVDSGLMRGASVRLSSKQIRTFTKQLAGLMRAKVPLFKALEILHREAADLAIKRALEFLKEEVRNGKKLSDALSRQASFSRVYLNLVSAGEKGGILGDTLDGIVEFDEKEEEKMSRMRQAFAYPIFMLLVGLGTVATMIIYVVPKLAGLYTQMGQELPFMTRTMIGTSRFAGHWGLPVLAVAGVAIFFAFKSGLVERSRRTIDAAVLSLPLFGGIALRRGIARFCRTLGLLLSRDIPIQQAIDAAVPTLGNRALEAELAPLAADVASGNPLSKSLSKAGRFPGVVISLLGVGEETGNLHGTLFEIASTYDKEVDERIRIMSSLLEPALILAIGSVVGLIVASMLLPIFELNFG